MNKKISDWTLTEETLRDVVAADFVGSKTVILAAGPPKYSDFGNDTVERYDWDTQAMVSITGPRDLPVLALLQDFNLQSQRGLLQFGEIGSDGKYFIRDRGANSVRLSRLVFDGPSLMAALYSGTGTTVDPASAWNADNPYNPGFRGTDNAWRKIWLNLDAKMLNRPFGLYVGITTVEDLDNSEPKIGEFYMQTCYIEMHNINMSQGTNMVAEGVSLKWSSLLPIDSTAT